MTTHTPSADRAAAPLWPHVFRFALLTGLTVAVFHYAIVLRGHVSWSVEFGLASYITLLGVGLTVYPRVRDGEEFVNLVTKLFLWVLASTASVAFHQPLLFYVSLLAIFLSTYRRCLREDMPSHRIGAAMVVAWLMSGVVLTVLFWSPRFHDLARMKYLIEASIYIDIRAILLGAGAITVATLAVLRAIRVPITITASRARLRLPIAATPQDSSFRQFLDTVAGVVNLLLLDHVEQFARTMIDIGNYAWKRGQAFLDASWDIIRNHLFDRVLFSESMKSSLIFLVILYAASFYPLLTDQLFSYLTTGAHLQVPIEILGLLILPAVLVQLSWNKEHAAFVHRITLGIIYLALVLTVAKWVAWGMDLFEPTRLAWGKDTDVYNWCALFMLGLLLIGHFVTRRGDRKEAAD